MRTAPIRPLFVALLLAAAAPAAAGDAPPADAVTSATAKVRAALPVPAEELMSSFEGELSLDGEGLGSYALTIDAGVFRDAPVWLVTEEQKRQFAGSERTIDSAVWLAKDLSLVKGEIVTTSGTATTRVTFLRKGDGFDLTTSRGTADPVETHVTAPVDATYGRGALLLFLKAAPKTAATYAIPLFFPDLAANTPPTEDDRGPGNAVATVEAKGPAKFGQAPHVHDTWLAEVRSSVASYNMHLSPKDRSLVAIGGVGQTPTVHPKGEAPKKAETDDDKPAATWKAAFLKFGHGYHMAIEKYLDAAFHWPTFHEHELKTGGWKCADGVTPEDDFSQFKKQWIAEFMAQSKHRPRADADALLYGTLATGTATKKGEDVLVFAADAQFGGGVQRTYHLKRIDGVWYIVRIE